MIWFFHRGGSRLQLEVRTETAGTGYELVITHDEGAQTIETYTNRWELGQRMGTLQKALRSSGWIPPRTVSEVRRRGRSACLPTSAFPRTA